MKQFLLLLAFTVAAVWVCHAQQIETKKVLGGYKYMQAGNPLSMGALVNTLAPYPQASKLIKQARSNTSLASVIGLAGGALIGFPLGTAAGGGNPNWALAGIGAGLVAVAIPISLNANKKSKQAVDLYNSSSGAATLYSDKPELSIVANGTGFGLSVNF